MANESKKPALYLAEYGTPNAIAQAAMKVRDAGYQKWDCHTPYAMHGMDEAMGLKPTRIGFISFFFGMFGLALAVFMMQYTNAFSFNLLNIGSGYPLIVGGKPPGAFPSMVPIIFELGILLCGLATLFGLLHIIKLPMLHHPIFESDRFEAATDDRFFISIEAGDQKFDLERTRALLEATSPISLDLIEEEVQ
jgi:hypothetical protein